jgi:hypothetical protein
MSRSGYSEGLSNQELNMWRGAVRSAIAGKRGQAFLREMADALDAMPVKELITDELVTPDGEVCAIGSVAVARQMDTSSVDFDDPWDVGSKFGIARALAAEIVYENDECGDTKYVNGRDVAETPAGRWTRMRKWVASQLQDRGK